MTYSSDGNIPESAPSPAAVTALTPLFKPPALSDERWHHHWRDVHGPMAARISLLTRYVQIHRVAPALPGFQSYGCIGVVDAAFASVADAAALLKDPTYLAGPHLDEANFLDRSSSTTYMTRRQLLRDPGEHEGEGKALLLLSHDANAALDGQSVPYMEAFLNLESIDGIEYHVLEEPQTAPFDSIVILTARDVAALERCWSSRSLRSALTELSRSVNLTASYGFVGHAHRIV